MRLITSISLVLVAILFTTASGLAQTADSATKPSLLAGEVVSIDTGKILLKTKDGETAVTLSAKTEYKRVPPENPVLKAAVPSGFADIGVGDKLVVTGIYGADKSVLPARSVYLMTKAEIAQRNTKESEQWRTRGITGKVIAANPLTKQITVETRGLAGNSTVNLVVKDGAKFLRYAPNSIRFDEAKPSALNEISPGDMLRALGDKSADGTTFTAEEVVTGAFQTVAGTVKSVDPAKNEIVITNLQTKKDMTIVVSGGTVLKKFPEEMAQRMAQFQSGGVTPGGQARPAGQGAAPTGQAGAARPGFGGQRGGGIDEMLDRFPTITAADLKAGDMIAVSSTRNAGAADRITAIKLLAGVEPFLRAAQAAGGARGQRGGTGDFNIPGLDGFSGF